MPSVLLITSFVVLALFGAIAILPALHKTIQKQTNNWSESSWNLDTLNRFGKAPFIFTLISAHVLSGWTWGSAVSWLLITLIFGLLLLPLTDFGFSDLNTKRPLNSWPLAITHGLFLIASLSILVKIVVGLIMAIPEISIAAILFIILLALNRYSSKASILLLVLSLISGVIINPDILLTFYEKTWLVKLLLSSFTLICLFSLSINLSFRTSLGILSGCGALIVSFAFIIVGLLYSGDLSSLSTPNQPALPLICLVLLLPGLLPGIDRSARSKTEFTTVGDVLTNSHLLIFIIGLVVVISIISMSFSFVNSFSNLTLNPPVEELSSTALSGNVYSVSFVPEAIIVNMIEQLLNALPINDAYIQISKYIMIVSLILNIIQLTGKQLKAARNIFEEIIKPRSSIIKHCNSIASWGLSGMILVSQMLIPALSFWLACSSSFAILIVHEFCTRSLKLSDTHPATRIYLSLSLFLLLSLALQLIFLTIHSGLQKQFSVTGVVFFLFILFALQLAPNGQVLVRKLKKAQSSSLAELKNL